MTYIQMFRIVKMRVAEQERSIGYEMSPDCPIARRQPRRFVDRRWPMSNIAVCTSDTQSRTTLDSPIDYRCDLSCVSSIFAVQVRRLNSEHPLRF
jgi:hypothetical protein